MRILLASLMVLAISCGGNSLKKDDSCNGTSEEVPSPYLDSNGNRVLEPCTKDNDGEIRCGSNSDRLYICSGCEWNQSFCPMGNSGYPQTCSHGACGAGSDPNKACCWGE